MTEVEVKDWRPITAERQSAWEGLRPEAKEEGTIAVSITLLRVQLSIVGGSQIVDSMT